VKKLLTFLLLGGLVASAAVLVIHLKTYPFPGNQEGYNPTQPIAYSHKLHAGDLGISCLYCHYSAAKGPHAGIPPASLCMNCHRLVTASWEANRTEADKARQEGRPPKRLVSLELKKLYDALGLDDQLQPKVSKEATRPIEGASIAGLGTSPLGQASVLATSVATAGDTQESQPIHWVRVHNLPQFTRFDHRAHVSVGVKCQECHGPVETMDTIRQSASLSMGWCVRCHKDHKEIEGKKVSASTDCAACHY
jgi:hypothetical protein